MKFLTIPHIQYWIRVFLRTAETNHTPETQPQDFPNLLRDW